MYIRISYTYICTYICHVHIYICTYIHIILCTYIRTYRDQPIMLILPIMLCCSTQNFDLLCSILYLCKKLLLKSVTVLLEYSNMSVILEYIRINLSVFYS